MRWFLVAFMCFFALDGLADEVAIKDGSVLTGQVLEDDENFIQLKTTFAGVLKIDKKSVLSVTRTKALQSGSNIRQAEDRHEGGSNKPKTWSASIDVSSQFTRGNTDSDSLDIESNWQQQVDKHRAILDLTWGRATSNDVKTRDSTVIDLGYHYVPGRHWFFALNGVASRDPISFIDARYSLHPAVGYSVWSDPGKSLSFQLGTGYSWERTAFEDEESSIIDWRALFNYDISEGKLALFHSHHVFQNLEGRNNLILRSKTGLRYRLNNHVNAKVQLNYNYQSEPVGNAKNRDSMLMLGLGSEF